MPVADKMYYHISLENRIRKSY